MTRWTARATNRGVFQGIAQTGRRISMRGIHIDRIALGKIAERWEKVDVLAVIQRIKA